METEEKRESKFCTYTVVYVILIGILCMFMLSCGTTSYHANGITPLNKQYQMKCKQMIRIITKTK